ncbi:MAG: amidohydrolase family protein [Amaricoccus sp.]|uniref:amidohydrolase family protein n=1 Tax=Amaricoccus sp. TaxID=1872485 RepID=UPI0039E6204C
MTEDLILAGTEGRPGLRIVNAHVAGVDGPVAISIRHGRIVGIGPGLRAPGTLVYDAQGAFAFGGFVESHIHLDKAGILDRCTICEGTLGEAVRLTAVAKSGFTETDVHARAARVISRAITHGTVRMRSFVEIDPRAGFRSFAALKRLREEFRFAIDLQICAFAQEGLTNEPETLKMLDAALADGADLVGGCPYTDPDPERHVSQVFDLAARHGVAVDFHLDFNLSPDGGALDEVVRQTLRRGWQGRASVGHVTTLSAMAPHRVARIGRALAAAGVSLIALPATDLFLNGRDHDRLVPRGVAPLHLLAIEGATTAIATNNVLNPFTPYGDASLIRMANLHANVTQLARPADLARAFAMVAPMAARAIGADHGLKPGGPATIVLLDCAGPEAAVREVAPVIAGWKDGRQSFHNGRSKIFTPDGARGP